MTHAELTADHTANDVESRRKAYALALRHSGRVRRLKIMLPIAAVVISAIFIIVSAIRAFLPENIQIAGAKIENGEIVMEKPAISGRNADGIFYSLTAQRALQSIAHPNIIKLETIRAKMPVNDTLMARVNAKSGIFDRQADLLDMTAPFTLDLSSGISGYFQSAHLDIKDGTMSTDDPVTVVGPQFSIVAQRLRMEDKGKDIIFDGGVKMTTTPAVIHKKDEQ
jgi:lipopolysaccharide export system protein LptC